MMGMDNSLTLKMKQDSRWYLAMSCIYGLLFTGCLYKNLSGAAFPVMVLVSILFAAAFLNRAGIRLKRDSVFYFAGILLLGVSTCLTANTFFHFFNMAGILLLLMAVMVHQIYEDNFWGFTLYVKNFFRFIGAWISEVPSPFSDWGKIRKHRKAAEEKQEKKRKKYKNLGPVILGIFIAFLFMLIVFPLLLMSDRVFSQMFINIFRLVDMRFIFEYIDVENLLGILFTFFLGMISIYAFFSGLYKKDLPLEEKKNRKNVNAVTGITFASVLAFIYVLYSAVQILFLFLRVGDALPDGMTYSEYAHEGFWQLLFVSIINFGAVLVCVKVFENNRILRILLCIISVCTCVMIVSAAYRMMLYVSEYNLTFLRVLVLWFLGMLMLIFLGVIYSIFREKFRLFRYIMAVVSVCYIVFSFSHIDAVIASYNVENTENMTPEDIRYLLYSLSEDAAPVIARIDLDTLEEISEEYNGDVIGDVYYYFENLRGKSTEQSLRTWNYARSRAYDAAENWYPQVKY